MINILTTHWSDFVHGFGITLLSSIIALIISMILGTGFAILEIVPNKLVNTIAHIYIQIFRNIPLLVVTMFFYVVVTQFVKMSGLVAGTIGLALYTSAFIAETVRAGILAVDKGQTEGARANGLTYWQTMRIIVLPQAFKIVIPPLGNQFINLVKNSSILAFVAGFDLMYQGNEIASTTFDTIDTYVVVGLFYLVITLPLSYYMRYLENKLA
ncbi:amino acid ABC transporter permease [Periweissella fabaria]|uniref:Glutamine ABC transporter permease protein GlnM n=1 Tax=Periweissella fabaria TaxID=546157 RepID=A0ABN8BG68_9LACO|nr:amino acid ABC transporter permease [Periweissella fabaria]MCM0597538.1 amino acid ABC transporter permease [Periweissella fabaria]CAH0416721.1 putative glutamine ABC transporter permease protein GlnM [Periweissella fabaria]